MKVEVIICNPQVSGNVGAIARVMKNFGFEKLSVINPSCDYNDYEARARAMHAKDILENIEELDGWDSLEHDYLVATTAMIGGDYNIKRSPVSPEELGERLAEVEGGSKVGIVFGREDQGLSNDEIKKCDFTVSIPTDPDYPTMNLSHSTAVVLYEVHKHSEKEGIGEDIKPVQKKEKEVLQELIDEVHEELDFANEHRKETNKLLWKRVIGRSMITNREAQALMGFFREFQRLNEKVDE